MRRLLVAGFVLAGVLSLAGPGGVSAGQPDPCSNPGSATKSLNAPGTLNGTSGNDILFGSTGPDVINGKGGDDIICGNGGPDKIDGGSGTINSRVQTRRLSREVPAMTGLSSRPVRPHTAAQATTSSMRRMAQSQTATAAATASSWTRARQVRMVAVATT